MEKLPVFRRFFQTRKRLIRLLFFIRANGSVYEVKFTCVYADWVRCTINRSHSTPCKNAEFEHLQIFPGHFLDFFLPVSGKICHSPIKKVKRQPTLIISFSQHSPFFEEQSKNPSWNPTLPGYHTLPQRCIFLHQPDKHRPTLNHMYI